MHAAALQQDASVFDYDGVYDAMQAAREAPKAAEKVQRQSRYIASLKEQAERRKREEEIAFERRTLKEQAKVRPRFMAFWHGPVTSTFMCSAWGHNACTRSAWWRLV